MKTILKKIRTALAATALLVAIPCSVQADSIISELETEGTFFFLSGSFASSWAVVSRIC